MSFLKKERVTHITIICFSPEGVCLWSAIKKTKISVLKIKIFTISNQEISAGKILFPVVIGNVDGE